MSTILDFSNHILHPRAVKTYKQRVKPRWKKSSKSASTCQHLSPCSTMRRQTFSNMSSPSTARSCPMIPPRDVSSSPRADSRKSRRSSRSPKRRYASTSERSTHASPRRSCATIHPATRSNCYNASSATSHLTDARRSRSPTICAKKESTHHQVKTRHEILYASLYIQ